ncbi:DinB family protein [Fulvivirga ligni]|uniref:DinB family protein n=1 Tax=Fulvivirga ligni TaxID=2904246 RepID=UPI001F24C83B|nr:DinB family protein [Fulvivirga ligni]UII19864.1 DinB family protein [Fulvivirga ligni]
MDERMVVKDALSVELILLNFNEIRRRSSLLWHQVPEPFYHWRPDAKAMSCIEMIRHVLEGEFLYHDIIKNKGVSSIKSPWDDLKYESVTEELDFAEPYRSDFIKTIRSYSEHDLKTIEIVRKDKNQRRSLGDYLMRIAYHEAVHTGQLLAYLRTLGMERPMIWD